jgi:hypothetical protein
MADSWSRKRRKVVKLVDEEVKETSEAQGSEASGSSEAQTKPQSRPKPVYDPRPRRVTMDLPIHTLHIQDMITRKSETKHRD